MASMKVAIVTPGSYAIPSPMSSSVERVIEKFAPLLLPHAEPRIYGKLSKRLPRKGELQGVVYERYSKSSTKHYLQSVGRSIKRFAPQVIDVENRPKYVIPIKRSNPGKLVWLYLHSSTFISPRHITPLGLRRCLRAADRIIVNSEYLRFVVASKVPEISAKLRVIYPGVDTVRFPSQYSPEGMARREALRQREGLAGRSVVLFMGRLIPLKGVHHLLRIVPQLALSNPELMVVIVGSPFYGSHRKTRYALELERLGRLSAGHVRFVPYVPYSEVSDWNLLADVAVVPSGKREAFGLVNVEAMSCGVPVVATNVGGIKEIIEDGSTGFLVNPARVEAELLEKLQLLLSNDELRCDYGMRSRERVEQMFTWQHTADRWLHLLETEGCRR
ncbi:glycosyltransferase family 4 protein [Paenibacillus harenae]|uniref:glycosyltransferase family 4 protein n=1 Tax=Paenibacillus harenae TaxID=306543 RepID=UPI00278C99EF|nr:glycosyltransferase family 4 protein [Paenibacillus harenae]MDQ0058870.1 spore coat protein SA [Paenibacillus harenae]